MRSILPARSLECGAHGRSMSRTAGVRRAAPDARTAVPPWQHLSSVRGLTSMHAVTSGSKCFGTSFWLVSGTAPLIGSES